MFALGQGVPRLEVYGTGNHGSACLERLKLVYWDEEAATGRIESLDDAGRVVNAMDMSLVMSSVPCFTPTAAIATKTGPRQIVDLKAGDDVITRDHGSCEIAWVGQKTLGWRELGMNPLLRPICIRAGAFGEGVPERDLIVSPNHHMLVTGRSESSGGNVEALVAARDLIGRPGIDVLRCQSVTYIQLLFARHEVLMADGCWSESFLPEKAALSAMSADELALVGEVHPEVLEGGLPTLSAARDFIKKDDIAALNC
jgi:hypothetical protein